MICISRGYRGEDGPGTRAGRQAILLKDFQALNF